MANDRHSGSAPFWLTIGFFLQAAADQPQGKRQKVDGLKAQQLNAEQPKQQQPQAEEQQQQLDKHTAGELAVDYYKAENRQQSNMEVQRQHVCWGGGAYA